MSDKIDIISFAMNQEVSFQCSQPAVCNDRDDNEKSLDLQSRLNPKRSNIWDLLRPKESAPANWTPVISPPPIVRNKKPSEDLIGPWISARNVTLGVMLPRFWPVDASPTATESDSSTIPLGDMTASVESGLFRVISEPLTIRACREPLMLSAKTLLDRLQTIAVRAYREIRRERTLKPLSPALPTQTECHE